MAHGSTISHHQWCITWSLSGGWTEWGYGCSGNPLLSRSHPWSTETNIALRWYIHGDIAYGSRNVTYKKCNFGLQLSLCSPHQALQEVKGRGLYTEKYRRPNLKSVCPKHRGFGPSCNLWTLKRSLKFIESTLILFEKVWELWYNIILKIYQPVDFNLIL